MYTECIEEAVLTILALFDEKICRTGVWKYPSTFNEFTDVKNPKRKNNFI